MFPILKNVAAAASAVFFMHNPGSAQVVVASSSTPSYTVSISVSPIAIVNKVCSAGSFSYQSQISYTVQFSPTTAPALNYLTGAIYCGGVSGAFTLPVAGGSGTMNTTTATYSGSVACSSATPSAIGCTSYQLNLSGTGINARSIITAVNSVALPVTLIRFDVRKDANQVYLVWESAAQGQGESMQLEQSVDASEWQASRIHVSQRPGAGSQVFEASDALPATGMRYYRLRLYASDGSVSYSSTIAVRAKSDLSMISIAPNPVSANDLRITGLENPAEWEMSVVNMSAQRLLHTAIGSEKLNLPAMTPGVYSLQLRNRATGESKALRFRKD